MDGKPARKPKKTFARRSLRAAAVLAVLGAVAVAALPWALGTARARDAALGAVNRALAPSKVGASGLSASWLGPIRVTGLTLRDGRGKLLVEARRATLDRGLLALLRDRTHLGTLTLEGAAVDIERRADGSIDLAEALSPPKPAAPVAAAPATGKAAGPATDLTLKVVGGSLRLVSPELAGPLSAERFDMEVRVPGAPGRRLTWRIRLANPPGGSADETLGVDGDYDYRAEGPADLSLAVQGAHWPLALAARGATARCRLVGGMTAHRAAGRWATTGDAKLLNLDAAGPALAGDRLAFDRLSAAWDLSEGAAAWEVRRLGVVSPVGTLTANGSVPADAGAALPDVRVEGKVDLAALSRQIPHTLRLREGLTLDHGSARVVLQVKTEGNAQQATAEAHVSDLVARNPARGFTLRDPVALTARATRTATGVTVESLAVKTAFLDVKGSGDLERGVKLAGTIDLGGLEAQFRELIDFGAVVLAGKGRMAGEYRRTGPTFVARYAAEVRGLKVAGVLAEPLDRDALRFDAAANGPAAPTGVPTGWANARVNLTSTRDAVTVTASQRDGLVSLNGSASVPVTVSAREGRADAKAVGRWRRKPGQGGLAGLVEIDTLRLGLRPADPALADAALGLAVRGTLDVDGDTLTLAPLPEAGVPALALTAEGLTLHGLRTTPLAGRAGKLAAAGDLARIDRALVVWTGREPNGLGGALQIKLGFGPGDAGTLNVGLDVQVPDLSRAGADGKGRQNEGPFQLACAGAYDPAVDRLAVGALALGTRYARVEGKGTLDAPAGRRVAELQGTVAPSWEVLTAMAAEAVEPKARLQGRPHPFRVKGPLSGDSLAGVLKGLDADLGVELTSADAMGLAMGPAAVVVHCRAGALTVDPIRTTLNNGRVALNPELTVDDAQGITVRLAHGSAVDGAEINDEVSRQLLSYVAPVLDKATHVNGKVSATFDRAEFPVTGPATRTTTMNGQVVFQDVVFAPGPFANQVLTLVGRPDSQGVRLHQPVQLAVADRRVIQKGLEVPVSGGAKVAIEGSVGFDQTLDLRATVPITKGMLGARSGLNDLVGDQRVTVPIGGTVSNPRVNRQALQVALRELSRTVLKRELSREASGLLDRLGPPPAAGGDGPTPAAGAGAGGDPLKGLEDQIFRRVLPPKRRAAPAP